VFDTFLALLVELQIARARIARDSVSVRKPTHEKFPESPLRGGEADLQWGREPVQTPPCPEKVCQSWSQDPWFWRQFGFDSFGFTEFIGESSWKTWTMPSRVEVKISPVSDSSTCCSRESVVVPRGSVLLQNGPRCIEVSGNS